MSAVTLTNPQERPPRRIELRWRALGLALLLHLLLVGLFLLPAFMHGIFVVTPQQRVQAFDVVDVQLMPQPAVKPAAAPEAAPTPAYKPAAPKLPKLMEPKPPADVALTPPASVTSVLTAPATASPLATPMPLPQPAPASPPSSGEAAQVPLAYLTQVMMTIGRYRRYPLEALKSRQTGTAIVHISLARDGSVLGVSLLHSSGYASLDQEACDVVRRIGQFGPLDPRYAQGEGSFAIDQPIRFSGY